MVAHVIQCLALGFGVLLVCVHLADPLLSYKQLGRGRLCFFNLLLIAANKNYTPTLAEVHLAVFGFETFSSCFPPPSPLKALQIYPKHLQLLSTVVLVRVTHNDCPFTDLGSE